MRSVWLFFVFVLMPSGGSGYPQRTLQDVIENSIDVRRQRRQATCGGEFVDEVGFIQLTTITENGTESYESNKNCTWNIKVEEDHHIILDSVYFELELSDDCQWDYVEIVDGDRSHKFCSWDPLVYVSFSNKLTLNFKSDYSYEGKGFQFAVMSVPDFLPEDTDKGMKCNSSIKAKIGDKDDIWNHEHQGNNCFYSILAPPGHTVQLKLKMLNFASQNVKNVLWSGMDNITKNNRKDGKTLWIICGGNVTEKEVVRANKVFIEYHNPQGNEGDRFQIQYSVVEDNFTPAPTTTPVPSPVGGNDDCSGIRSDIDEGFTDHILYDAPKYEDDRHCVLVVRTSTLNHMVQVHFNRFEMEDSDNCEFDSLNIFSGERNDSAALGGPYCDSSLNGRTLLSGTTMKLVFKTDHSLSLFGFQANFTFVHMDNLDKDCGCSRQEVCVVQGFEKMCIAGSPCARCENGATCVNNGSVDHCYCSAGYTGQFCNERAVLDGKPIGDHTANNKFGDAGEGLLMIDAFDEQFEGRYTCEARAGNATAEHTFTLKMIEDCRLDMKGPSDITEDAGKTVILSCSAVGALNVWWEKDDGKIKIESTGRKFTKMANQYLRIANVSTVDSGEYTCVANGTGGCLSSRSGRLTVLNRGTYEKYCGISVHDQVRKSRAVAVGYISMGTDANQNEHPWHVSLFSPDGTLFCGGSLITKKFVVTAAHCIRKYKGTEMDFKKHVTIDFGSAKCSLMSYLTRSIKSISIHDRFNETAFFDSDIALLELSEPVEYSNTVRPICVFDYSKIERLMVVPKNPNGMVAGCGRLDDDATRKQPPFLQNVVMPYTDRDTCKEDLESTEIKTQTLTENIFCAGHKKRRVGDVCKGDSGGGFMMDTGMFQWVLAGIVSFGVGFKCDTQDHYSYFTNVGKFYNWINDIVKFTDEKVNLDFLAF